MSNNNIQNAITNCIAGLLTDADEARNYAQDPQAYLADKLDGHDIAAVDMPAAVRQATVDAKLPTDTADAINDAVYQPAATVRVQRHEIVEEEYPKYDRDDREYVQEDRHEVEPPKADEYKNVEDTDEYKDVEYKKVDEKDPADMIDVKDEPVNDYRPAPQERPVDREYENEAPRYEELDNGGYRAELPQDWDHNTYTPDNYGHEGPMDLDCVEYSVSNCVTTAYGDTPEIADEICENRNWEDPYVRNDPSHDFEDMRPTEPYAEQQDRHAEIDRDDADRYDGDDMDRPVVEDRHDEQDRYPEQDRHVEQDDRPMDDANRYDGDDMERHEQMTDEECDERDAEYGEGYDAPETMPAPVEAEYHAPVEAEYHAPVEAEYHAPVEAEYEAPVYAEPEVVIETPEYPEVDTYEAPAPDMAMDDSYAAPAEEMMVD